MSGEMQTAATQLAEMAEKLRIEWEIIREKWTDSVAENLNNEGIVPLLRDIRQALDAVREMSDAERKVQTALTENRERL